METALSPILRLKEPSYQGKPYHIIANKLFSKKMAIILKPTEKRFNVKNDLSELLSVKGKDRKIDRIDPNFIDWFGNVTINGRKEETVSFLYEFLKDLSHKEIISISKEYRVYKKFNIFDAVLLIQKIIDINEIWIPNATRIAILLEEQHNNLECKLEVFCVTGGKIRVRVYETNPAIRYSVGGFIVFGKRDEI
ncbi:MAG: hypothetical protein WC447_02910 [Candidatus Paceibacterota bacterium]|jgi:hypothetical protein